MRPEHLTEVRALANDAYGAKFGALADVVEPMGMETLVYFTIDGTEVCARLDPAMAPDAGQPVTLMAAMSHMHLLDAETDKVL